MTYFEFIHIHATGIGLLIGLLMLLLFIYIMHKELFKLYENEDKKMVIKMNKMDDIEKSYKDFISLRNKIVSLEKEYPDVFVDTLAEILIESYMQFFEKNVFLNALSFQWDIMDNCKKNHEKSPRVDLEGSSKLKER